MKDILIDENFDLVIENGDLATGDSEQQSLQLLLKSNKGDFKYSPQSGFGIDNYIKETTNDLKQFERNLKVELEADGFTNPGLSFGVDLSNLEITINQ